MTDKVTFARDYTDWSGTEHKVDSSAELDASETDHVLRYGYARPYEPASKTAAEKKES